jgi:hypothetical protein
MALASPITTTATLLRQSVVVSPSDRFGGCELENVAPVARQTECPLKRSVIGIVNKHRGEKASSRAKFASCATLPVIQDGWWRRRELKQPNFIEMMVG